MSMSLRDQLLAAGLVSKKQVQQSDQQKRQQSKSEPNRADEQKRAAQKAAAEKAARDAALNKTQQDKAERKARTAQVKQLVEQNRLPKPEGDDYYNFIDGKKIKRVPVDAALRAQLVGGELFVVRCEGRYDLVPSAIAERIAERDAHAVMARSAAGEKPADQDDPYKDFVVPDDLKW